MQTPHTDDLTLDLIGELEQLREHADAALKRLQNGEARNGHTALRNLKDRADVAARYGRRRVAEASRG